MINSSVPVVVIYRGGHSAVSIARTLGRMGVPVYLVAQPGLPNPGWWSRYWTERVSWDFSQGEQESLSFLLDLGARIEADHARQAIALTLVDWIAVFIERNREALRQRFDFPAPERPVIQSLLNKWQMHELAIEHGIPTPAAVYPISLEDVDKFAADNGFPMLMKGAERYEATSPPTMLIRSREELLEQLGGRAAQGEDLNVVLQEYIPGGVDTVWMCNGYFSDNPDRDLTFTGKKLRQVSSAGIASLAVCVPNETVASQTRQLMRAVGYRGCVGIGWRYDHRDGQYKLLDVNARVSGVFRLFTGTNKVDVVRACYLDLTGQPIPATELQSGRKWMLEDDFAAAAVALRRGELSAGEWARSVRGVRELHWLAIDDPLPFLARARDMLAPGGPRLLPAANHR